MCKPDVGFDHKPSHSRRSDDEATHVLIAGAGRLGVGEQGAELLLSLRCPSEDALGRRELPVQAGVRHPHNMHLQNLQRQHPLQGLQVRFRLRD